MTIPLVFPLHPAHQPTVQTAEDRVQRRSVVFPIVVDPPPDLWVVGPGQALETRAALPVYPPSADLRYDGLGCLTADARSEADEVLAVAVQRRPGTKRVSQKVETDMVAVLSPVAVLTVDDLRLLRVRFQLARLQPLFDRSSDRVRLRFRPAVNDHIVRVAFEWAVRMASYHPTVEHMMQKDVGQQG